MSTYTILMGNHTYFTFLTCLSCIGAHTQLRHLAKVDSTYTFNHLAQFKQECEPTRANTRPHQEYIGTCSVCYPVNLWEWCDDMHRDIMMICVHPPVAVRVVQSVAMRLESSAYNEGNYRQVVSKLLCSISGVGCSLHMWKETIYLLHISLDTFLLHLFRKCLGTHLSHYHISCAITSSTYLRPSLVQFTFLLTDSIAHLHTIYSQ